MTQPTTVVGANGTEVMKARWLDVAAGEFLTVGRLLSRNPGPFPLYRDERDATSEELAQVNSHLASQDLSSLNKARVGDEPVTKRLIAVIPVMKDPQ